MVLLPSFPRHFDFGYLVILDSKAMFSGVGRANKTAPPISQYPGAAKLTDCILPSPHPLSLYRFSLTQTLPFLLPLSHTLSFFSSIIIIHVSFLFLFRLFPLVFKAISADTRLFHASTGNTRRLALLIINGEAPGAAGSGTGVSE